MFFYTCIWTIICNKEFIIINSSRTTNTYLTIDLYESHDHCNTSRKQLMTLKFGAMHFIYYINRSIVTKVDSTYLDY